MEEVLEVLDVLDEWGHFTGKKATREECHKQGLWHRAVYAFIINDKGEILLQRRSKKKKNWPNKWDVTVGGHVNSGEFGRQALIRETEEELGLKIDDSDIKYIVGSTSIDEQGGMLNKHFNECYLIKKSIDISKIKLQQEEVSEVRFFTKEEILKRVTNDYYELTNKIGPWNFLERILTTYVK